MAAALAVPLGLTGTMAAAQGTSVAFGGIQQDTSAPVEVTSDSLSVDQEDGTAVFEGDVAVSQGEMRLQAARVQVVYDEAGDRIARMEASGGVTLVSAGEAAEAERATYDIDAGSIVMEGSVLLTQGPSTIAAERMVVDLDSGQAQMTGRVRTVLQNGSK